MSTVIEIAAEPGVFGLSPELRVYDVSGLGQNHYRVSLRLFNGSPIYGSQDSGGPGGSTRNIYDLDLYTAAFQEVKDFTDPWSGIPVLGEGFALLGWDNIQAVFGITLT